MFRRIILQGIVALFLCVCSTAQGQAIATQGTLNITGAVSVTPQSLDFLPPFGSGVGTVQVGSTGTGIFATALGSSGLILDIPYSAGTTQPGLLTLVAFPGMTFDLTELEAGVFKSTKCSATRPAAGQTCTPAGSALSITNTSSHSCSVSISLRGNFREVTGEETPYVGVITFQFADRNFQQLLAGFAAGDFPMTTFSASFSPAELPQQ